jgi:hypothetical protein
MAVFTVISQPLYNPYLSGCIKRARSAVPMKWPVGRSIRTGLATKNRKEMKG